MIADLIVSKASDPAVLICDEKGKFVVPILSGHIGGANKLALELAAKLGMTPVITTATDLNAVFAIDTWAVENDYAIADISKIKLISAALLRGETIGLASDFPIDTALPKGLTYANSGPLGICISYDKDKAPFDSTLTLVPKAITLGAGCKKDTRIEAFANFVAEYFLPESIVKLASIDIKAQEPCLLNFANKYKAEFTVFTAAELAAVAGDFSTSSFVQSVTGVDNVCERAVVLAGDTELYLHKTSRNGMTIAATAATDWRVRF
jgi:cobalt-precorrin 5A hydrolase